MGYVVVAMPATNNPFPGMNPFLQASWGNVRTRLISYIVDALAESLPLDLSALVEEHVALASPGEKKQAHRVDVAVLEPWQVMLPTVVPFNSGQVEENAVAVAEPLIFAADGMMERWIEIHDVDGNLITVIEVLSPTNKQGPGQRAYQDRQRRFLSAGVQSVEIDLIRGGGHAVSVPADLVAPHRPAGTCHLVCTTRWPGSEGSRWEVYLCPLQQPLPTIRVPLRSDEPDVALALQPLVDRCYRTGRYWQLSHSVKDLHPPLADAEEVIWAEGRLHDAGARR